MGIWATAEGGISHHINDRFSIKKFIEEKWAEKWQEYTVTTTLYDHNKNTNVITESVYISWDSEGVPAALEIQKLIDSIHDEYKNVRISLEATIRFF